MKIKAKLMNTNDPVFLPWRKRPDDAGADLRTRITNTYRLYPQSSIMLPTGVGVEIPEGYFGLILPRSGAAKEGKVTTIGTIDSGYRGELMLNIVNPLGDPILVHPFERLAQLVILPYAAAEYELTEDLSQTDRGSEGFGSSGRF